MGYFIKKATVLGLLASAAACSAIQGPPPAPPLAPPPPEEMAEAPQCFQETFQVYFASDQTTLDSQAGLVIDAIVEAAGTCKPNAIEVVGHADSIGSEDVNLRVSQRRADAVLQAILAEGLDIERIEIVAAGEKNALTEDDLIVPMNRRVEVRFAD
ncbi:MAG: hypothetical protein CMK06_00990 [Ponticaulis sp.]|nr:hypothetical protein [Ponticaulis sp.]|tara:strand:- start:30463 stop:30930 length:468 start_codon:yes stop_codon:yes gene_type:complete